MIIYFLLGILLFIGVYNNLSLSKNNDGNTTFSFKKEYEKIQLVEDKDRKIRELTSKNLELEAEIFLLKNKKEYR